MRYYLEAQGNDAYEDFMWAYSYAAILCGGTHTDQTTENIPGWRNVTIGAA